MTGQEILLTALKYPKDEQTRKYYRQLSNLYQEEFGVGWMLKEIAEARKLILDNLPGGGREAIRNEVSLLINLYEAKATKPNWIGTRFVSGPDFLIYSKGIFWMAGYDLLNNL